MTPTEPVQLVSDTRDALQDVRRALIELYGAVGANPDTPQVVSRQYGINRNLTWKLARIINASNPFDTLNHLPGEQGVELAIKAFEKAGAPDRALALIRSSMDRLRQIIAEHAGTREHLELTLESMGVLDRETGAERGREMAFRGNSSVWGIQADVRFTLALLAPGRGPGTADLAMVSGLVGFRRLRPGVQWKLFQFRASDDRGRMAAATDLEEFEEKGPGDAPWCIREFCSAGMPRLIERPGPDSTDYLLPGGPVGRQASFDVYYGNVRRNLPMIGTAADQFGSAAAMITLPVATLVFDLIVHRDIAMPVEPEVVVIGYPGGGLSDPTMQAEQNRLPNNDRLVELAGSPPAVYTPAVPNAARILERAFARMGATPSEFRGRRLQAQYPPMNSVYALRWALPIG